MTSTTTVTSADGTEIAFYRTGTGPALVLVDAALCFHDFGPAQALATAFAPHFTVYAYDRRGRGQSGDHTDRPSHAVEREVEDLAALIAEAGGSAYVYGISSGAALALHAAAVGLPISKLGLFEPPFTTEVTGDPDAVKAEHARLDEMIRTGRRSEAVETYLSYALPPEAVLGMKASSAWAALVAQAHTTTYDNAVMGDGTVPRAAAARITAPTVVVAGGASPDILRQAAAAAAEAIPGALYREIEGLAHTSDPAPHAPVLREFFTAPQPSR